MIVKKRYNQKDKTLIKNVLRLCDDLMTFKETDIHDLRRQYGKEKLGGISERG